MTSSPISLPRIKPHESWIYTASRRKLRLVAAGIGAVVFGSAMLLDGVLVRRGRPRTQISAVSNGLMGFITGWFVMRTMEQVCERRENVAAQLKTIADMNHHIRNALQTIQFSAYSTQDQQTIAEISYAVERIQWALREVLPGKGSVPAG
jgi:predicted PurR-regulated permease PerM